MPSLDDHGKLGAAIIPFYLPFIPLSIILAFRHGFGRNTGWVYLCVLAIVSITIISSVYFVLTDSPDACSWRCSFGSSRTHQANQHKPLHRGCHPRVRGFVSPSPRNVGFRSHDVRTIKLLSLSQPMLNRVTVCSQRTWRRPF